MAVGAVAADDVPTGSRIHAGWTSLPLGEVASQATRFSGVPVIVDRRIDPTTRITLEADGLPVGAVAAEIAVQADADVAVLPTLVRIAPPANAAACEAAQRLRMAERRRLPAAQRATIDAVAAWTWPAGARPRDLVVDTASAAGIAVDGAEAIPHDHFPAAALPPLSLADRLDLVLAHFDRRVEWSTGKAGGPPRARVVSLPLVAADAPRAPRPARPPATAAPAGGTAARYTLRVEAPLEQVLAAVGKRLGLTVAVDEASLRGRGIAPGEIVRASVADATRDELLDAIMRPLDLAWEIDEGRLRVWASEAQ